MLIMMHLSTFPGSDFSFSYKFGYFVQVRKRNIPIYISMYINTWLGYIYELNMSNM